MKSGNGSAIDPMKYENATNTRMISVVLLMNAPKNGQPNLSSAAHKVHKKFSLKIVEKQQKCVEDQHRSF